jgi:hypothetical protein
MTGVARGIWARLLF